MSVPLSASGITRERSRSTSCVVAASAGPFAEIVLKYAVVPALSIWIGETATTPAAVETSFCSVASRGSPARGSPLADEPPPLEDPLVGPALGEDDFDEDALVEEDFDEGLAAGAWAGDPS